MNLRNGIDLERDGHESTSPSKVHAGRYVRFDSFELDLDLRQLRRNGKRCALGHHAFHILAALIQKQGEVLTREELYPLLWPTDAPVDVQSNVNTTLNKLRGVLGDSGDSHVYIETIPRQGYRFVATLEYADERLPLCTGPGNRPTPSLARSIWPGRNSKQFLIVAALCLFVFSAVLGAVVMTVWFAATGR